MVAHMANRMPDDLCNQPLVIAVHRGAVILIGPGNVALAMTVTAAEKSAAMLLRAAQKAGRRRPQL